MMFFGESDFLMDHFFKCNLVELLALCILLVLVGLFFLRNSEVRGYERAKNCGAPEN